MKKEVIEIEVVGTEKGITQTKALDKSIKDVSKSAKASTEDTKDLGATALESAKSFEFMGVSVNKVSGILKILKVSLIATGIGAIVVAVGALASAFLSTQSGVDKLNSVLMPLKEVLATIWGVAQKLGTGLFQMVSGDVRKGWKSMGDAVENVGDQMDNAYKNGTKLYKLQKQIRQDAINDGLVTSRLNRLQAESLEIAGDINKSVAERQQAFKTAIASASAITKLQQRENDNQVALATAKTKANDTDDEAKRALNELIAKGEDIQSEGIKKRTELQMKLNSVVAEVIPKQTFDEWNAINDGILKKIELEKAEKLRVAEERFKANQDLKKWEEEQEHIKIDAEDYRLQQMLVNILKKKAIAEEEKAIDKEVADAKKAILDAQLNNLAGGFALMSQLAGKNKVLQATAIIGENAVGIAKQIIATRAANALVTTKYALLPGGAILAQAEKTMNNVSLGLGIATSVSATAKALSALGKGGDAGGGAKGSDGGGGAQSPNFNIVGRSSTNQLAESIGGQAIKPVKAYVVSKEMSSQQEQDRNTQETATFG
jgi:hypothetical protein